MPAAERNTAPRAGPRRRQESGSGRVPAWRTWWNSTVTSAACSCSCDGGVELRCAYGASYRVLCPVDFSDASRHAPRSCGDDRRLVPVAPDGHARGTRPLSPSRRSSFAKSPTPKPTRSMMSRLASRPGSARWAAGIACDVPLSTVTTPPHASSRRCARRRGPCRNGHAWPPRLRTVARGSVAERVVRTAPCRWSPCRRRR